MRQFPLISVLMSVHNAEQYVAQAVESILNQTFTDFEFLIIDDGSTDRSLKILQEYEAQDPRIQLMHQDNQGLTKTLNHLIKMATGEFLARMDADDIALPNRFHCQIEFLQQHPTVVCVGGGYEIIDHRGRLITRLLLPLNDDEIQRQSLAGHTSICHPCAMMRRASLVAIGGYNETLVAAQDLDLWLRLGEIGQLANLKEFVLQYRFHTNSISEKRGALQHQMALEACQQAWQRRGITGQFEMTEHWRPSQDRQSRHRFMLQYGWWAFNSGQRQTAAIYGLKAIQVLPLCLASWKLLSCALLKPLPKDGK